VQVVLTTTRGTIVRQRVREIGVQSRSATGVRVQRLDEGDSVQHVAVLPERGPEDEDKGPRTGAGEGGGVVAAAQGKEAGGWEVSMEAEDEFEAMAA
jgi:DNA gyrase/topoisomerase IV subunit A